MADPSRRRVCLEGSGILDSDFKYLFSGENESFARLQSRLTVFTLNFFSIVFQLKRVKDESASYFPATGDTLRCLG